MADAASGGPSSNKHVVLFGAGMVLGSAIAFGAAYGLSRYLADKYDGRRAERSSSTHSRHHRSKSPTRMAEARPMSPRTNSAIVPPMSRPSSRESGRDAVPNGSNSSSRQASKGLDSRSNAPYPAYLHQASAEPLGPMPMSMLGSSPVPMQLGMPMPGGGSMPIASAAMPSPLGSGVMATPMPAPAHSGKRQASLGINPIVASPRNQAYLARSETLDGSDFKYGLTEVDFRLGHLPANRRESEAVPHDPSMGGHGRMSDSGVATIMAATGGMGVFAVPPADRANKSALELVKTSNKVAGHMPKNVSSGNLQAMATAAAAGGIPPPKAHNHGSEKGIERLLPDEDYCRVITPETVLNEEIEEVCSMLAECLELRQKWLFQPKSSPEARRHENEAATPADIDPSPLEYRPLPPSHHTYKLVDGVMHVYSGEGEHAEDLFQVPGTANEFFTLMHRILRYSALGPVKSFCHHRLMLLEQKFNLHVMLNADKEFLSQKAAPHRDFYNVRKVDTHIHHSACMHQKHLLRFIKSKLRKEPDEVVIFRDGKYLTLKEVFESLNLTGYDLNVDTLDMHADKSLFHRFDKFNLKYNPCGQSRLREIFIKQDNLIHGRFLAELTREVFTDLSASKYQHTELRISVYGRKAMEWDILASWVVAHELYSNNNVWLIQIPRLYNVYKETGVIENFQQMLDNIFTPLFEVTQDPSSHPQLHVLLSQVVGFDMVDDESKPERRPTKHSPPPAEWNSKHNCAYSYYAYYIYANLYVLNKFRESRGLNTFTFRPHAGEAGDIDHLAATFLLCENIAHGINLRKSPCLQYLYYLAQVGLCMSPLSNNSLFLDYHRNPFPVFFARGLSVSLSTDDPLQIHLTKEPLVEEYSVAAQVWKMSSADLCEIARNGVLHSGFPHACKKHWVASDYWRPGPEGNDIHKTNVPNMRLRFRYDTYIDEMRLVGHGNWAYQARKGGQD